MGGGVCIFGVLTVNLLTPDADNEDWGGWGQGDENEDKEGDERASMKTEPRHHWWQREVLIEDRKRWRTMSYEAKSYEFWDRKLWLSFLTKGCEKRCEKRCEKAVRRCEKAVKRLRGDTLPWLFIGRISPRFLHWRGGPGCSYSAGNRASVHRPDNSAGERIQHQEVASLGE